MQAPPRCAGVLAGKDASVYTANVGSRQSSLVTRARHTATLGELGITTNAAHMALPRSSYGSPGSLGRLAGGLYTTGSNVGESTVLSPDDWSVMPWVCGSCRGS
jgi:hypothetical protein